MHPIYPFCKIFVEHNVEKSLKNAHKRPNLFKKGPYLIEILTEEEEEEEEEEDDDDNDDILYSIGIRGLFSMNCNNNFTILKIGPRNW